MSVKVEFGFNKDANGGVIFNDISSYVRVVSSTRGKDPQQDTFNAGNLTVELTNETRAFDPNYAQSPFQGQILPSGSVRVSSNDAVIFTGKITDWNFRYEPSGLSVAEIIATDSFWDLNNQTLIEYAPSEELSSTRINNILSRTEVGGTAAWPTSRRVISTGVATVGDYTVSDGTNVLAYLQEVEKAESGRLFIDKLGRLVFRSRNNDISKPSYEYTRTNLSSNPSFENNTQSWVATTGTITRSTASDYVGVASGSLSAGGVVEQYFTSEAFSNYVASVYAKSATGTAVIELAAISTTGGTAAYTVLGTSSATVTTSDWTRVSVSFEADTAFSGLRISQTPTTNEVLIDAVLIEQAALLDAYFDGSNEPVYNTTDPDAPDYQPERAFEEYLVSWILD
jgi:hypothetical protein